MKEKYFEMSQYMLSSDWCSSVLIPISRYIRNCNTGYISNVVMKFPI